MITLYTGPLSLFARKVEIALAEKALGYVSITVPFNQTTGYDPKHPDVVALNPKGQVPVLSDDGLIVYDSTVILEYLDEAYPQPPLYPARPTERARCRMDELFADEIIFSSLRPLMHRTAAPVQDRDQRAAQAADAQIAEAALARHHADLDIRLGGREFFGLALSVADIALFVAVLFGVRLGGPSLACHSGLSAWFERLMQRPAFATVAAGIAEADRRLSVPVERR